MSEIELELAQLRIGLEEVGTTETQKTSLLSFGCIDMYNDSFNSTKKHILYKEKRCLKTKQIGISAKHIKQHIGTTVRTAVLIEVEISDIQTSS